MAEVINRSSVYCVPAVLYFEFIHNTHFIQFFLTREVCIFGHRVGVPLYTAHFVCFPHRTSKMSTTVVG